MTNQLKFYSKITRVNAGKILIHNLLKTKNETHVKVCFIA